MPQPHPQAASRDSQNRHVAWLACLAIFTVTSAGCSSFTASGKNADGVRMYQQGQYQAAIEKFQQAANSNPNDPDAAYNLGRVHHRLAAVNGDPGAVARAEQYYQIAIDHDANHVESHRALAVLYVEQGQSNRAFDLLGEWAMSQPGVAEPHIELARLHEEFGDKDAAQEQLLEAMGIDRNNPRTLAALGRLRDEAGQYAQAMDNYQRALELDRFQPELAARVTALQGSMSPSPVYPPPSGDTRMVESGTATRR